MPDERDRRRTPAGRVRATTEDDATPQKLGRAMRDTQQVVKGAADRVDDLRREVTARIDQLDAKVDDAALCSARVEGKVDVLIETVGRAENERSQIRVSAVQANIEVEKTGEISKIQEAVDIRADRRKLLLKVVAVAGPIIAAALGLMAGRC